ncbi:hypothetical protein QBC37DRAFT_100047 [Rhypophila decipiens]|uniref:Secreted protein n=1 Tax=Rhypophila decipiens TaxID=261697 RepID=A0AAN7BA41_9PEZI|nr:hypothetical protein QBC37DRAFT_100047 [Rhypophila decipiens]
MALRLGIWICLLSNLLGSCWSQLNLLFFFFLSCRYPPLNTSKYVFKDPIRKGCAKTSDSDRSDVQSCIVTFPRLEPPIDGPFSFYGCLLLCTAFCLVFPDHYPTEFAAEWRWCRTTSVIYSFFLTYLVA